MAADPERANHGAPSYDHASGDHDFIADDNYDSRAYDYDDIVTDDNHDSRADDHDYDYVITDDNHDSRADDHDYDHVIADDDYNTSANYDYDHNHYNTSANYDHDNNHDNDNHYNNTAPNDRAPVLAAASTVGTRPGEYVSSWRQYLIPISPVHVPT